jgi:hypothetical protein
VSKHKAMASDRFHIAADDSEKPCDKCGAPPSWAELNNLPWRERLQYHCLSFDLSPRMWPMGYILRSPYSPFYLEREIPNHNWRDAFEDLIALDSGGEMISTESRKREEEVAARLYVEGVHSAVSHANETLKLDQRYLSQLHKWRAYAVRQKNTEMGDFIASIDTLHIPTHENHAKETVKLGEELIARLKENQTKDWPGSRFKLKTHWIASLVSSGAVPEWQVRSFETIPTYFLARRNHKTCGYSEQGAVTSFVLSYTSIFLQC